VRRIGGLEHHGVPRGRRAPFPAVGREDLGAHHAVGDEQLERAAGGVEQHEFAPPSGDDRCEGCVLSPTKATLYVSTNAHAQVPRRITKDDLTFATASHGVAKQNKDQQELANVVSHGSTQICIRRLHTK
jgi:hypothetical protein